jgi:hypothetical protein
MFPIHTLSIFYGALMDITMGMCSVLFEKQDIHDINIHSRWNLRAFILGMFCYESVIMCKTLTFFFILPHDT